MKKILKLLLNTRAAAFYILCFALAIGIATFIENDFGTSTAQKLVYKTKWFELLLLLFSASLIANIIWFKMIQQKKWALISFHLSMVLIIIGAGVTRYIGFEGIMPIREQSFSNTFLSAESYLQINIKDAGKDYLIQEPLLLSAIGENELSKKYIIGQKKIKVKLTKVIPNPQEIITKDPLSGPLLHLVLAENGERENYYLRPGDVKQIGGEVFNFTLNDVPGAHQILLKGDRPYLIPSKIMSRMEMATQKLDTIGPQSLLAPIKLKSLHTTDATQFVFKDFLPHATIKTISSQQKLTNESSVELELTISVDEATQKLKLIGQFGQPGKTANLIINNTDFSIAYGAILKKLPFSIGLKDFQMERYPGTNSAVSYASEVLVKDQEKGVQFDYRIYMNHILNYRGFRFFQSSFDNDEKGTYLSVNHDFWGTWISYIGYALLTLGMALTFVHKQSRMQQLSKKIKIYE